MNYDLKIYVKYTIKNSNITKIYIILTRQKEQNMENMGKKITVDPWNYETHFYVTIS